MKSVRVKAAENLSLETNRFGNFFSIVFEYSELGIVLTDDQGTIVLANPQFSQIALQSQNKILFPSLLRGNRDSEEVDEILYNNGAGFLKITSIKLHEKQEGASYLWLVARDRESAVSHKMGILKNLYRSFIDTTFELVFRTDTEGKIIFANQLFLQNFGFTNYRKVKESKVESLFEDPARFMHIKERVGIDKRVVAEMVLFKKVDGGRLTGLVNCSVHTDGMGLTTMNWAVLNISQQVESEKALKDKNDELAKVNHQMEKFLYSTSHDLRSPLTSILGLVNLMRMETKESTILDYIDKVESSTLKLDKIIKDIMSFSRTTYQRTASEKIDFETQVWKSLNHYRSDPTLRKINFEVKAKGSFPFFNDPERIEIIIDNIVRNSINFYDVNKARPFIKVNITIDKDQALLEFIDNGIGIGSQHLEHIFNMFYKASHHSKGAGLGLFIVKETLEKLQGSVTVESEIGFGTVIRITIPNDHKGRLISRKLQLQNNS